VDLPREVAIGFYEGYSNQLLGCSTNTTKCVALALGKCQLVWERASVCASPCLRPKP